MKIESFINKNNLYRTFILLLRFLIGGIFICSGFVKAIDIWGVEYKIEDYLTAFNWTWGYPFTGFFAVVLPLFEFVTGALLFVGSFRRTTVFLLLACMAAMLPLSAYIWIADPVSDCGCFGDALILSNAATFWKNIFITAGLVCLLRHNHRLRSFYGPAVQWLTALIPTLYLLPVIAYGNYIQPMLDFRPFKIGTSIIEPDSRNDGTEFLFSYRKGNETKEFTVDNLPDTSWTFVDRKEIKAAAQPANQTPYNPIAIFDGGQPASDILPSQGETLLILIPDIGGINALTNFRLNDLNDLSNGKGIPMICLTSSSEKEIAAWRAVSMSSYPVYQMDDSQLKTIARGNPAIVYLKNGIIGYKSTFSSFLDSMETEIGNHRLNLTKLSDENTTGHDLLISLSLILIATMTLLFLINRTHLLIKFGLRWRKNQNKKVTLPKE